MATINLGFSGDASSLISALRAAGVNLNGLNANLINTQRQADSTGNSLTGFASKIKGAFAGIVAISALKGLTEDFVKTRVEYEKLEAALSATTGAADAAGAFKALQQFAKETPYDVDQTVKAFLRLNNAGIKVTDGLLKAFGNVAAAQPGKTLQDVSEAVIDALQGEYERLKEFGVRGRAIGKDGKEVALTFQGITTNVKTSTEALTGYLEKTFMTIANGKAMENQAKTLAGRYAALTDSYKQFQNSLVKSSGLDTALGGIVDTLSERMQMFNDTLNSGAFDTYVESVKTGFQPIFDLFDRLKEAASNLGLSDAFKEFDITDIVNNINELVDTVSNFGIELNAMIDNNVFAELFNTASQALEPFKEDLQAFSEFFVSLWTDMPESIKQPLLDAFNYIKEIFSSDNPDTNGENLTSRIGQFVSEWPSYIQMNLQNAIAYIQSFVNKAIGLFGALGNAIKSLSSEGFSTAWAETVDASNKQLNASLNANKQAFDKNISQTRQAASKLKDAMNTASIEASGKKMISTAATQMQRNFAAVQYSAEVAANKANAGKDLIGMYSGRIQDKFAKGKSASSPAAAKKSKGSKGSAEKVNAEYKQMLSNQEAAENDSYKRGEISAQNHFDKLLEIKLQQLKLEEAATQKSVSKNNEIINDTNSTEDQKAKALKNNQDLQTKMNGITEKEKGLREDIARQLRDAKEQYAENIQSLKTEIDSLSGTDSFEVGLQNFEQKYKEMKKRIAAEDAQDGANNMAIFNKLQAITEANLKIKEANAKLDTQDAQNSARKAELEYEVAAGLKTQGEANKELLTQNEALKKARVEYYQNEVNIAQATAGFNQKDLAGLREKLALAKTASMQLDQVKEIQNKLGDSFTSFFEDLTSGTESVGDAFKNLGKSIVSSINSVIAENLSKQLMASLFSGSANGGASTGLFATAGNWITNGLSSLLSGSYATGGIMRPNSYNLVGENGPEIIKTGATSDRVFNRSQSASMLNGSNDNNYRSGNVYVNVTSPDANSFNRSKSQVQQNLSRELSRSYNRNS